MPKLFTHLTNGLGTQIDRQGSDVADVEEAIHNAARSAASVLEEDLIRGVDPVKLRLAIEDERGRHLAAIEVAASIDRP